MAGRGAVSKEDQQLAGLTQALTEENVKPSKGLVKRIWSAMGLFGHLFFRSSKEDFEKRLQHLSKEEVAAHTRLKRRTQFWRKFARGLILYSVIGEILVLGVAIYSTRNVGMAWQTRAWRVLPVFVLPLVTTLIYSSCASVYRMRERKDQKTLERLRTERQEKIDELKEKTNYYMTQQLIQKYDMDPAAKAAAASVLASKLGSESGLKFALQAVDNLEKEDAGSGDNSNEEATESTGLRNRRNLSRRGSQVDRRGSFGQVDRRASFGQVDRRTSFGQVDRRTSFGQSNRQGGSNESVEIPQESSGDVDSWEQHDEVEHYSGRPSEGGWIARLAAMLVGEDPSQCYALICGKCRMHNGLAKKEDYEYITYYCPHCGALNKSNHLEGGDASDRPGGTPTRLVGAAPEEVLSTSDGSPTPSQEAASSEALVTSALLATIQEPQTEGESSMTTGDS